MPQRPRTMRPHSEETNTLACCGTGAHEATAQTACEACFRPTTRRYLKRMASPSTLVACVLNRSQ